MFWNIMAGGGKRAEAIVEQIKIWEPGIVTMAEFRATAASQWIAHQLYEDGWEHQLTTSEAASRTRNALLLASRYAVQPVICQPQPEPAHRWLLAKICLPVSFHIGLMHIPNAHTGLKVPFHQAILSIAKTWKYEKGVLIGDTNSGLPDIDEESPAFTQNEVAFMNGMERTGWRDAFRLLYGQERAYTWYSPNGKNGFRLDQAFVTNDLVSQIQAFQYAWGHATNLNRLSDHAAIILDIDLPNPTDGSDM